MNTIVDSLRMITGSLSTTEIVEAIRQLPDYANKVPGVEELAASIDAMERSHRAEQFVEYELQVASREA